MAQAARREAKLLGLAWRDVQSAAEMIRVEDRELREQENAIRRRAWERHWPPGCAPFWRHGWYDRYPQVFAGGLDWRSIPGFDVLADGLAYEFPELRAATCVAEGLFETLSRPYRRALSPAQVYAQAMERVAQAKRYESAVPF